MDRGGCERGEVNSFRGPRELQTGSFVIRVHPKRVEGDTLGIKGLTISPRVLPQGRNSATTPPVCKAGQREPFRLVIVDVISNQVRKLIKDVRQGPLERSLKLEFMSGLLGEYQGSARTMDVPSECPSKECPVLGLINKEKAPPLRPFSPFL